MFSDRRIRRSLEAGKVGVWYWDVDRNEMQWSPNLNVIHRLPTASSQGTLDTLVAGIHPDDRDRVQDALHKVFRTGGVYETSYRLPVAPDGEERWIEAKGNAVVENGVTVAMLGVCQDISGRKRTERELELRLLQQEVVASLGKLALEAEDLTELFRATAEKLAHTLQVDCTQVLELQPGGEDLLLRAGVGWRPDLVGTATVSTGLESQAGYTLMCNEPVVVQDLGRETRFTGPALLTGHGVVSGLSTVIAGPDDTPYGVLGVHSTYARAFTQYDINFLQSVANILGIAIRRHHAEAIQDLLYRELRHRFGNLFAQLLSLHSQTAMRASSMDELVDKFGERVQAVARAYELISRSGWSSTSLQLLLQTLLAPYGGLVDLRGPSILLPADTAFALGLAVNELATNAVKYGCLSKSGGNLEVRWDVAARDGNNRIVLDWVETCNRTVEEPEGTGFGTRLVDVLLDQQLTRRYTERGLRLRFAFTLEPSEPHALRRVFDRKRAEEDAGKEPA